MKFTAQRRPIQERIKPRPDTGSGAAEQTALWRHQRRFDLLAIACAQRRAQVADAVDQAVFHALSGGPVFTGEKIMLGTGELRAAPRLHQIDEGPVDVLLD